MTSEPTLTPPWIVAEIDSARQRGWVGSRPDDRAASDPFTIINRGKSVWKIIQDNRPVTTLTSDYAEALPHGVTDPFAMQRFSDVQYQSWRMTGKNLYGMTVYDLTITLVHQYGGQFRGRGHYLSTVGILPSMLDVMWGYKLNFDVSKVAASNVGTSEDPVGSVAMEVQLRVATVIKNHVTTTLYQFRGDSPVVRAN